MLALGILGGVVFLALSIASIVHPDTIHNKQFPSQHCSLKLPTLFTTLNIVYSVTH